MPTRHALHRGARAPRLARVASLIWIATALAACGVATPPATPGAAPGGAATAAAGATGTCLPGERGFLNARLKGAIDAEIAWQGNAVACEGGARPAGRGLRASFLGRNAVSGQSLRFVFGLAAQPGAAGSHNVAAHLTVIAEGAQLAWATQGDGQCMVESLQQERLPGPAPAAGAASPWRIAARGYCIDPAVTLDGTGRLYVDRFDFAGVARFEENELHETAH
jgi:hypothetical protein